MGLVSDTEELIVDLMELHRKVPSLSATPLDFPFCYSPVLLWMVLTVVVVRGGDEDRSDMHSSSWEQPFSMALT